MPSTTFLRKKGPKKGRPDPRERDLLRGVEPFISRTRNRSASLVKSWFVERNSIRARDLAVRGDEIHFRDSGPRARFDLCPHVYIPHMASAANDGMTTFT